MTSKLKTDVLETVSGSGTIALTNQLSGMTSASMPSGSVIQVANLVIDTETTASSTSWVYAGGSEISFSSLTSTGSKVLVRYNLIVGSSKGSNIGVRIYRNVGGAGWVTVTGAMSTRGTGSSYNAFLTDGYNPVNTHEDIDQPMVTGEYLDSPSTTSSVAYRIYMRSRDTSAAYINRPTTFNQNDAMSPRAISTATLMEIKG
jgi:hypothetical protein